MAFSTAALVLAAMVVGTIVSTRQAIRATTAEALAQTRLLGETEAKVAADKARAEETRQRQTAEKVRQDEVSQRKIAEQAQKDEAAQRDLAVQGRIEADEQRVEADKQGLIAKAQRDLARDAELLARCRLYAAHIGLAHQAWDAGNLARALELLEGQGPKFDQQDLRTFEWYYLWRVCHANHRLTLAGHTGKVCSVDYSPDGKMLASASGDTTIRVWDSASGRELAALQGQPGTVWCVAFSPDGKTLASTSGGADKSVQLWDVGTWKKTITL